MRLPAAFLLYSSFHNCFSCCKLFLLQKQCLKESMQQAAAENKNVFIIFHASWCGWCHKMDTSMNDQSVKIILLIIILSGTSSMV